MRYELNILDNWYTYRSDILEHIISCLDDMIQRHCKVFTIRLDVRFPEDASYGEKNTEISKLMSRFHDHMKYHGIDMMRLYAREQNSSHNPHYHVVLFIDGSKTQNGWGIRKTVENMWSNVLGRDATGCVHLCKTHDESTGVMIRRPPSYPQIDESSEEELLYIAARNAAINWSSYLAKTATKGNAPHGVREFQGSQLKKRKVGP